MNVQREDSPVMFGYISSTKWCTCKYGNKKTWHLQTLRIKHRHDDMIGNLCAACDGPQESKIQESRKPADGHKSRGFNGLFNTGSFWDLSILCSLAVLPADKHRNAAARAGKATDNADNLEVLEKIKASSADSEEHQADNWGVTLWPDLCGLRLCPPIIPSDKIRNTSPQHLAVVMNHDRFLPI